LFEAYIWIHVLKYIHINMYTYICIYVYICMFVCIYINISLYVCNCIFVYILYTEIAQSKDDMEDLNTRKMRKMYVHMMELGALSHLRALQG
jgi:hypothetical protein